MKDLSKIQALLRSPEGEELRLYLASEVLKLRLIENIAIKDHPFAQAVETLAQKKAYEKVNKIFERLNVIADEVTPAPADPRDSYTI